MQTWATVNRPEALMKDWRVPREADARRIRQVRGDICNDHVSLDGHTQINFCSNDYLGFSQNVQVCEAIAEAASRYGVGAGASPLITGYTEIHEALEEALARFTGRDCALVFSSGYLGNLGCITALAERTDTILEDRLNHASLLDAVSLSGANRKRYAHADFEDAARLMSTDVALLVTEGVFSMGGDIAPIRELAELAHANGALLMCDDAHGLGVLGEHGGGVLEDAALGQGEVPLLVGTLSKALGAQGGFVAGPHGLMEHLLQYARTYTYDTALAPPLAAAALESLQLLESEPEHLERLRGNIDYFLQCAQQKTLPLMPSRSAIQPLLVGKASAALAISQQLREKGFAVSAIRPPTVPEGSARLRITLSACHTHAQIDKLIEVLGTSDKLLT